MKNLFLLLLLSISLQAQKSTWGIVDRVVDGDTYLVTMVSYKKMHNVQMRIRLSNVDCPETYFVARKRPAQPYGDIVKKYMVSSLEGKKVKVTYHSKDLYGRLIAELQFEGGAQVDEFLLSNGWAWAYSGYFHSKQYKKYVDLMMKAKEMKLGLWSQSNPIRPSKWRSMKHKA